MPTDTNITFGLKASDIKAIADLCATHPNIEKVILFGSRAIGSHKPTSDIDLAIIGEKVDLSLIFLLNHQLDQLPIIQTFDLLYFNKTENQNLLEHIDNHGIEIFDRETYKLPPQ